MIERLPPPENHWVAVERIRCLQALYQASVTSGGRTEVRNAAVGGHPYSKHQICYGCNAWDLVPNDLAKMPELGQAARLLGFWAEVEADHVHCQSLPAGPGTPASPVV